MNASSALRGLRHGRSIPQLNPNLSSTLTLTPTLTQRSIRLGGSLTPVARSHAHARDTTQVGREFLVQLLGDGAGALHDLYAYALGMHLLWLWAAAGCAGVQVSGRDAEHRSIRRATFLRPLPATKKGGRDERQGDSILREGVASDETCG